MTVHTEYDAPVVWLPKALDLVLQTRDHYADRATMERKYGRPFNAGAYDEMAVEFDQIADRFSRRLAAIAPEPEPPAHAHTDHCLTLNCGGYLSQEPPSTLVELVNWLRAHIGAHFPWVPAEVWQRIGYLILMARGLRP